MTREDIQFVKQCIQDNNLHRFYLWAKWKSIRSKALSMDKYECQDCKANKVYAKATTVHHENYVKRHPDLALELWYTWRGEKKRNLISLCHDCHEKRHGYRKPEKQTYLTEEKW